MRSSINRQSVCRFFRGIRGNVSNGCCPWFSTSMTLIVWQGQSNVVTLFATSMLMTYFFYRFIKHVISKQPFFLLLWETMIPCSGLILYTDTPKKYGWYGPSIALWVRVLGVIENSRGRTSTTTGQQFRLGMHWCHPTHRGAGPFHSHLQCCCRSPITSNACITDRIDGVLHKGDKTRALLWFGWKKSWIQIKKKVTLETHTQKKALPETIQAFLSTTRFETSIDSRSRTTLSHRWYKLRELHCPSEPQRLLPSRCFPHLPSFSSSVVGHGGETR